MFIRIQPGLGAAGIGGHAGSRVPDRRRLCQAIAAGPILLAGASLLPRPAPWRTDHGRSLRRALSGASAIDALHARTATTDRRSGHHLSTIIYEFGSSKESDRGRAGPEGPPLDRHHRRHGGEAESTIAIDDLLKAMPLEERLYRHRCVEAWSMAVPWSGFPLKALVDFASPPAVPNTSHGDLQDPEIASGQQASPGIPGPMSRA